MGTAVLRSPDSAGRFRRARPSLLFGDEGAVGYSPNPRSGGKGRGGGRRGPLVMKAPGKSLVMEEVTILKRGEETKKVIDAEERAVDDVVFSANGRLGPEPEILPKSMGLRVDLKGVYAGSGFVASPAPSCVPFPSFFAKKDLVDKADLATKSLRFLLQLDVV